MPLDAGILVLQNKYEGMATEHNSLTDYFYVKLKDFEYYMPQK
jgi:hypothetical protein